jgi:hypothetical protein
VEKELQERSKLLELDSYMLEEENRTSQAVAIALQEAFTEFEKSTHKRIVDRTSETILDLLSHTLVMGLSLGSIWIIHLILDRLLGHDAMFFDAFPVRWLIDVADILVIGKFLWEVVRDFTDDRQKITVTLGKKKKDASPS